MDSLVWNPLALFWGIMVFASITWYALLLFLVGYKGGREIVQMTKDLSAKPKEEHTH
ncbi:MAG: hypothetical protein HUU20_20405 [Pirellulales bacterium]|nr:hypothetical protein [Pirellulales bacterium]